MPQALRLRLHLCIRMKRNKLEAFGAQVAQYKSSEKCHIFSPTWVEVDHLALIRISYKIQGDVG